MKFCPKCSTKLAAPFTSCEACPWTIVSAKRGTTPRDPMHLACEHTVEGQRCAELGTMSTGTHGEGPWFCAQHFLGGRYWGEGKKPLPPPQGFKALKDVLRHIPDPEAEAERAAIQAPDA